MEMCFESGTQTRGLSLITMEMTFEMINMNKIAGVGAICPRDGSAVKRTYSVVEDLASVPSPQTAVITVSLLAAEAVHTHGTHVYTDTQSQS